MTVKPFSGNTQFMMSYTYNKLFFYCFPFVIIFFVLCHEIFAIGMKSLLFHRILGSYIYVKQNIAIEYVYAKVYTVVSEASAAGFAPISTAAIFILYFTFEKLKELNCHTID